MAEELKIKYKNVSIREFSFVSASPSHPIGYIRSHFDFIPFIHDVEFWSKKENVK